jgi:hypothetical protein
MREQTICSLRTIEDIANGVTFDQLMTATAIASVRKIAVVPVPSLPSEIPALLLPEGVVPSNFQLSLPGFEPRRVLLVEEARRRIFETNIAHELSHELIEESGVCHLHGDVWALTMCLLAPRSLADAAIEMASPTKSAASLLGAMIHGQSWCAEARISMLSLEEHDSVHQR